MNDETLGNSPETPVPVIDLEGVAPGKVWTVEDVLNSARRVETIAHVCLRADLEAEYHELGRELATLVTPDGELLNDGDDESLNGGAQARAVQIISEQKKIRTEMAKHMWHVRFRGMASEDFAVFNKKYLPKDGGNGIDYNHRLVAACAIEPTITLEQVRQLHKTLSPPQMGELIAKASEACTHGGVDVPK